MPRDTSLVGIAKLNSHITPIPHRIGRIVALIAENVAPTAGVALVGVEPITRKRALLQPHTAGIPAVIGEVEQRVVKIPARGRDGYGVNTRGDSSAVQVNGILLATLHRIDLTFVTGADHMPLLVYASGVSAAVDRRLVVIAVCAERRAGARPTGIELDNMTNGRSGSRLRGHCGGCCCKCHCQSKASSQNAVAQGFHHIYPPFHEICDGFGFGAETITCAPVTAVTSRGQFPGSLTLSCNHTIP